MKRSAPLASCMIALLLSSAIAEERTVSIESARNTEYVKRTEAETEALDPAARAYGGEVIRFSGDVRIVVTEGSSVSTIGADEIIYDKGRDTLEAVGNVTYEHKTGASGGEKYRGEALLFDIKKQEGVFMKGVLTQDSGKKDGDPYIIHAEITGRDSSSTIAFKNALLTTCDADDPHWSINASRVWMLPGNEIAILNGLLYIGPLPVFYIPFFYYPGDEMIVHPVFGFRNREGYFVQTTTYLYGRKPLAKKEGVGETSFSDFLTGDTLKEQRREGLFLRNLAEDAKSTKGEYLKLMVDGYSSLGGMVALEGSFNPEGYVRSVKFLVSGGFSRTLYQSPSNLLYSTYDSSGNEHYNGGIFFGQDIPFRYRTDFTMQMDKAPFQISVSLPLVSDPDYKDDFFDRSEDLNWFKYLTEQAELARDDNDIKETSYQWMISGSIKPSVTALNPYITSFSITSLSGTMLFNSKRNATLTGEESLYSPERMFYYPELIKPELKLNLAGTIVSSSGASKQTATPSVKTHTLQNPLASDSKGSTSTEKTPSSSSVDEKGEAPQDGESADQGPADNNAPAKGGTDKVSSDLAIERFMPKVPINASKVAPWGGYAYSVTWAIDPQYVQEIRYSPLDWQRPSDVNWNDYSSLYYQFRTSARIQGNFSIDDNFLTLSTVLNFTGTQQDHPWLSDREFDTKTKKDAVYLGDYKANVYQVTMTDSIRLVPFNRSELYRPISLSWDFKGDVVKREFSGTADNPEWDVRTMSWNRNYVSTHSATSVLGLSLGQHTQKLTVTSNLPPLLESYAGNAQFAWAYGALSVSSKYFQKELSTQEKEWYWDPLRAVVSWGFPVGLKLGQEYTYDIENEESTRLALTASYGYLSAYYSMTNTIPYTLESGQGWVLKGSTKEFIPTDAGVTFDNAAKPLILYRWKNRVYLNATLFSNLKFDLLKVTDSSFTFSPRITLKIHEFLDFSFSSTSSNEVIARYVQDWLELSEPLPGETNVLEDVIDSFNFFDTKARESSGFKLKNLKFDLTHYLHDWTMNLNVAITPELKQEGSRRFYDFTPFVTFMVQWKPISDIKTKVKSEDGVFTLNTTGDKDDDN